MHKCIFTNTLKLDIKLSAPLRRMKGPSETIRHIDFGREAAKIDVADRFVRAFHEVQVADSFISSFNVFNVLVKLVCDSSCSACLATSHALAIHCELMSRMGFPHVAMPR